MKDKFFLKSKTLWGGLIVFLPVLLGTFGVDIPDNLPVLGEAGASFLDATNEIVGALLIAWGRYTAGGTRLVVS